MFSEDSKEVSGSVPSIISTDLKIVGDLKCTGDIQIDGTIEGSVTGGLITIGEQAKVEGLIVAETVPQRMSASPRTPRGEVSLRNRLVMPRRSRSSRTPAIGTR